MRIIYIKIANNVKHYISALLAAGCMAFFAAIHVLDTERHGPVVTCATGDTGDMRGLHPRIAFFHLEHFIVAVNAGVVHLGVYLAGERYIACGSLVIKRIARRHGKGASRNQQDRERQEE